MLKKIALVTGIVAMLATAANAQGGGQNGQMRRGDGPRWGGDTLKQQLSPSDAKQLDALRAQLETERERYRALRQKGAPAAETEAQWEKVEKIRLEGRAIAQKVCPNASDGKSIGRQGRGGQGMQARRGAGAGQGGGYGMGHGKRGAGAGMGRHHRARQGQGQGCWMLDSSR